MLNTLLAAEAHMKSALELLDQIAVPADIGANLDLAIHRLTEFAASTGLTSNEAPIVIPVAH